MASARCTLLHPALVSPSCPAVTPVSVVPVLTYIVAAMNSGCPICRSPITMFCVYLTNGQLNNCKRSICSGFCVGVFHNNNNNNNNTKFIKRLNAVILLMLRL